MTLGAALHNLLSIARGMRLPNTAIDALLDWAKKILPSTNILPTSWKGALRLLRPFTTPVKKIPACINGCQLFCGETEGDAKCRICGKAARGAHGEHRRSLYCSPLKSSIESIFSNSQKLQQIRQCPGPTSARTVHDFWGTSLHLSHACLRSHSLLSSNVRRNAIE